MCNAQLLLAKLQPEKLTLSLLLVEVLFSIAKMVHHLQLLNPTARKRIIRDLAKLVIPQSPFFTPTMKTGTPFQYEMTNCGELGWVSDTQGYRYTHHHPVTKEKWAILPDSILAVINFLKLQGYLCPSFQPEACLVNKYLPGQKLGLHQDKTEKDHYSPIVSISLGAPGIFVLGGQSRTEPKTDIRLEPGDVLLMDGCDRLRYHGFKGITEGTKRINLTIRQVNISE
jgi:alkylated DNA repair protein (DNA oxidative demethylase)